MIEVTLKFKNESDLISYFEPYKDRKDHLDVAEVSGLENEEPKTEVNAEAKEEPKTEAKEEPKTEIKFEDLQRGAAALAQGGKRDELEALLNRIGVKSMLELGEDQFFDFLTGLKELGADI